MKAINHVCLFVGVACLSAIVNGQDAARWKAGAAAIDITPDGPVWLAGYGSRNKPSEGVTQRIYAKALAIDDNANGRMVIVTLDLIGVPRELRDGVERRVHKQYGLSPASVLLNASHTHSGPAPSSGGVDDPTYAKAAGSYQRVLEEKIVQVIGQALSRSGPANLHFTRARAGFAMNRRLRVGDQIRNSPNPEGPVDHEVPVLRVIGSDGNLKAMLFGSTDQHPGVLPSQSSALGLRPDTCVAHPGDRGASFRHRAPLAQHWRRALDNRRGLADEQCHQLL